MTDFDELWKWAQTRGTFQQEYSELKHVFNLMKNCNSYLEVGCAEGNSLYILGSAVNGTVDYIDIDENHTRQQREQAIEKLGKPVGKYHGDSTDYATHPRNRRYDCILIDGGHNYETVLSDSKMYADLADKFVFWHDIQLPEVRRATDRFRSETRLGKYTSFINSNTYGFLVCEVR